MSSFETGDQGPEVRRGDTRRAVEIVWDEARRALESGQPERFSEQEIQRLMSAALKLYASRVEFEDRVFSPLVGGQDLATPTEVVVAVSEILRAVDLNTFDLAMWFNRKPPETGRT